MKDFKSRQKNKKTKRNKSDDKQDVIVELNKKKNIGIPYYV